MRNTWSIFKKGRVSLVLGVLVVILWVLSIAPREVYLEGVAYVVGILATVVCMWLFALIALSLRAKPGILAALLSVLRSDKDAHVRVKAAQELAELDVEQSTLHHWHGELDSALIATLGKDGDKDPNVRSEVVEGLANVESELFSDHHKHTKLYDFLYGVPI